LRSTLSVLTPPLKVGVAPTTEPLLDAIVTLWDKDETLVKAIVTLPADADSDVVLYLSAPLGSAASVSVPAIAEDAELAALLTAELADELTDEAADEATELAEELIDEAAEDAADAIELLALDPPHPVSAVSARRRPAVRSRFMCIPLFGTCVFYRTRRLTG
jgi:hypothetical protein